MWTWGSSTRSEPYHGQVPKLQAIQTTDFQYLGSELATFAKALRWKAYLRSQMSSFIRGRVAEIGAGLGSMTSILSVCDFDFWLAVEPDARLAGQISRAPKTSVFVGTLANLPAGELFDSILYIDVIEHIEDDAAELSLAANHLAPGGHLIILVPAHNFLYTPFDRAIGHYRRYNKRTLRTVAPQGFNLVHCRYLDSVGMLASLGNKLLLRQASPSEAQILLWDSVMVPVSRFLDPLLGYRLGKSLLGVWRNRSSEVR